LVLALARGAAATAGAGDFAAEGAVVDGAVVTVGVVLDLAVVTGGVVDVTMGVGAADTVSVASGGVELAMAAVSTMAALALTPSTRMRPPAAA
jgi:hypothetical protein